MRPLMQWLQCVCFRPERRYAAGGVRMQHLRATRACPSSRISPSQDTNGCYEHNSNEEHETYPVHDRRYELPLEGCLDFRLLFHGRPTLVDE